MTMDSCGLRDAGNGAAAQGGDGEEEGRQGGWESWT